MLLSVKKPGQTTNELRFKTGPIYIGRQVGSQVFLPDISVSRQHSVLYQDISQKWVVEDLGSTNKTFVNNQAVHKHFISDNDTLNIGDFTIQISLKEAIEAKCEIPQTSSIHLDDTLAGDNTDIGQIIRQPTAKHAPPISFSAHRIKDFQKALKTIQKTSTVTELHQQMIDLLLHQFSAYNVWATFNTESAEIPLIEGGKQITSQHLKKETLPMCVKIPYAMEKQKYLLIPQIPRNLRTDKTRSIMIAPIFHGRNTLGVLYVSNSLDHEQFELADLDYLMLFAIVAECKLERV